MNSLEDYLLGFFSINIASNLAVVTKARLDSIAVRGDCECGDAPPPPPVVVPPVKNIDADIVYLVDRSESITEGYFFTVTEQHEIFIFKHFFLILEIIFRNLGNN